MPVTFSNLLKIFLASVGGVSGTGYAGYEAYKFLSNKKLQNELESLSEKSESESSLKIKSSNDMDSFQNSETQDFSKPSSINYSSGQEKNEAEVSSLSKSAEVKENKESEDIKSSKGPEIQIVSQSNQLEVSEPKLPQIIVENEVGGDWEGASALKNKVYDERAKNPIKNRQQMSDAEKYVLQYGKESGYWDYRSNLVKTGNIEQIESKEQLKKDAEIYKMLKDHTVKLASPCSAGTGWLLDFELPKEKDKYPTKWFIATNLHVISEIKFKKSEYDVLLPVTEQSLDAYVKSNSDRGYVGCANFLKGDTPSLDILTEEDVTSSFTNLESVESKKFKSRETDYYTNSPIFIEMAGGTSKARAPKIFEVRIANPKLIYTAINFAGKKKDHQNPNKTMDYYKDFGVVEVDFGNEDIARKMTNRTFDKYYKHKVFDGVEKINEKSVNMFATELMSKYTADELNENQDHFLVGGYPQGGNTGNQISFSLNQKYRYKDTFNSQKNYYESKIIPTRSKLTHFKEYENLRSFSGYNLTNKDGDVIRGHIGSDRSPFHKQIAISWNGKPLINWGYNYLLDNTFLGGGASGSMVLDKEGGLLGLYTRYAGSTFNYGVIEPVRGSQVKDEKGRVIIPQFDLIAGKGGDISSYRTQLEKYGNNIQTYLSHTSKWKAS
ncbi:MIP family Ig-specific serine endopeptidase [Mycoplasma parvum]|uniref:DUF31 domain-containing protein n=1 Tax=Mycoplasma parvum str. Indiana TaxID=1403316 RepID=U5NFG8_9MOLU|nr:hypothetical protein [Mycoplasma parvum]AGX88968.1 hypothetical protein PRV_01020 [Mycoplasma parvum str. Indiana]